MDYEKLGYLSASFKFFHLRDIKKLEFQAHYHEFDKIILFLGGKVRYVIEGQTYRLFPYDIIFIGHNSIHYPIVDSSAAYERVVIYINPLFLKKQSGRDGKLSYCFDYAKQNHSYVMHLDNIETNEILHQLKKLENSLNDTGFAQDTYTRVNFLEFMILLNRAIVDDSRNINAAHEVSYDENIMAVLAYINKNLFSPMDIDHIAGRFFVSKYYLMRRFKAKTGYSIHQYILNKRLMTAKERIKSGVSLTQICFDCGFKDYSAFSRSFKQAFGQTPRELKKAHENGLPPQPSAFSKILGTDESIPSGEKNIPGENSKI